MRGRKQEAPVIQAEQRLEMVKAWARGQHLLAI
jgi:hypothetical protein